MNILNAHSATLAPIAGIPLPAGIQAGDRLELAAQPLPTREVIGINTLSAYLAATLPLGHTYDFVIERSGRRVTVPVSAVNSSDASGILVVQWISFLQIVLLSILALLITWRGRDRAAVGMAFWTIGNIFGGAMAFPLDGLAGLIAVATANFGFVVARVGFYIMADAIARPILSLRMRRLYLGVFVLVLSAGTVLVSLGGPFIYAATGWAGGLLPISGVLWSASYLVPIVLLLNSYQHATSSQRLRLRWMLWSSVIWLAGIVASNTPVLSVQFSVAFTDICQLLGVMGFLYAVLRHRVLDVSVVLDRTLVYGTVTALVVGVLAAVNSLVQHAALGTSASLLLQVAVPLSLGIVLTRVRAYLDRIVEQMFFHKKYLADKALRRFARLCSGYENAGALMTDAVSEIRQHLRTRGVAIYERRGAEYVQVQHAGEVAYPERVKVDDKAFVAARADQQDIDLIDLHSELGSDGYVFPMAAHGEMPNVLVCANRPGEHYAADERQMLLHLAHEMGMALYALRMNSKARIVEVLAQAPANALTEVQQRARMLLSAETAA
ncbi:MAG: hypothetical protein KGL13_05640 [Gammaproteobacteria bacterium]|nr:hypothetical protein [Gammaproteobacteria bacterium]